MGELRLFYLGSPAKLGRGQVREERGRASGSGAVILESSGLPRNGLASCRLANENLA
jgi:hypothetical protein